MTDMRDILNKVKILTESRFDSWEITDPLEIRIHLIDCLIDWYNGGGYESSTLFIELLPYYMSAIGAKPNENSWADAKKTILKEYRDLSSESDLEEWEDEINSGIANLRKIGADWQELTAIEKSMQALLKQYNDNLDDEFDDDEEI